LDSGQIAKLRAERASARRAAIALEDNYGPGAAALVAQSGAWGGNSNTSASPGLGGSTAFGGSLPYGNATGFNPSLGTTGSGGTTPSTGSNTGTSTGTNGSSGTNQNENTDLNAKVLEFALKNTGKKVGDGECWALAAQALAYAGAAPPKGYVFGQVVPLTQAMPGDILQFYNANFIGDGYWMIVGRPHHTAIVQSIDGYQIAVLNQNVNRVKKVQTSVIDMAEFISGTITVYRPIPANSNSDANSNSSTNSNANSNTNANCKKSNSNTTGTRTTNTAGNTNTSTSTKKTSK
jgi:hypothetical protein